MREVYVSKAGNSVLLQMTKHDAQVLAFIMGRISGPLEGPRGAQDRISRALDSIGIRGFGSRGLTYVDMQGGITLRSNGDKCPHCDLTLDNYDPTKVCE